MTENRPECKFLIYPENGSWVAHCLEMDVSAKGKDPNEAVKILIDSVFAATSEQTENEKANINQQDLIIPYPDRNPLRKMRRHLARKLISTVDAVTTPFRQLPKRLLTSQSLQAFSAPPGQPVCGQCGKAADPSPKNASSVFNTTSKTNPTNFSFNKKETLMSDHDRDLGGDDVKFVEYSILSIKRDAEKEVLTGKDVISGASNGDAFTAKLIKNNAAKLQDYEAEDLRVYYKVVTRYARPEQQYDKNQADSLKTIADAVTKYVDKKTKTDASS